MELNQAILLNSIKVIVNELMESSSSSSDFEINMLIEGNSLPRVKGFVEDVVGAYTDTEFKKNFRVSREISDYLESSYAVSSWYGARIYRGGKIQAPPKTHILAFLWFSANKTTFREVANLFDLALSSMFNIFNKVLNFIINDVAPVVIKFPMQAHEKEATAREFENISGFPNVLGCIDGSFIASRKPKHKIRSTYTNRHDCVSITLQGICDARLRFLDVFTGVPSKIHDSRVLKLSFIGKELANICGPNYHLLGDSAYPLREYLLTPFRDYGNLREDERFYNTKFCQTRVKIENAFGLLKSRFRQLMRLDFHNVQCMAKFVISCCALHNLCIERGDSLDSSDENINDEDDNSSAGGEDRREQLLTQLGQIKRNSIKTQLFSQRNQQIS